MINADQIARDLRVFADPATPFSSAVVADRALHIRMVRDDEREYVIDLENGSVIARHQDGKRFRSLAALLASEEFVDIRKFKASQRRILLQRAEAKGGGAMLSPAGFVIEGAQRTPLTAGTLHAAVEAVGQGQLSVLLIDGPAGIGKTSLIEQLSLERTSPDSAGPPLLHVVSGGSKLTDLSKALAHSLQVIRSVATFDQVPILARLGVIQIAIDGFDELVDPDGYKDAWSALREFLGDVGSGGPIILSGRDTFFDQQNFERLLAKRVPNLATKQVRLSPVSPSAAKEFLGGRGWSTDDLESAQSAGWFRPGSYQLRPFFLAQVADEGGWKELEFAHGSPQSFLVSRMVRREANLLARTVDVSAEQAERGLMDFFGSIAEDMNIQQTDAVDEEFIAFACEAAFEAVVSPQDLPKLVHKASSFALLEASGAQGLRRFPHSEFQNQFAARAVLKAASASPLSTTFIRQAAVSVGVAEAFHDVTAALAVQDAQRVFGNLMVMLRSEAFSERVASNIAALLLAMLSRTDLPKFEITSTNIHEARLVGVTAPSDVSFCAFGHLNVAGADCSAVDFRDSTISVLTVSSDSLLPAILPAVGQLHYESNGQVLILRAPAEIEAKLASLRVAARDGGEDLPLVKYFERLCRTFVRQYQIRDHDDDDSYRLLQSPYWGVVREIAGDRIVEQVKVAGGPRSVFYRMEEPERLLVPEGDSASLEIRNRIIARARAMEVAEQ